MSLSFCPPERPGSDAMYQRQRQVCAQVVGIVLTLAPAIMLAGLAGAATNLDTPLAAPAVGGLAALWFLLRIPGVVRRFQALRRCPSCDAKVALDAEGCGACGQPFGTRPPAPEGSAWAPPAFLARPIVEVEARAASLRKGKIITTALGMATFLGVFAGARFGHPEVAAGVMVVAFVVVPLRILLERCPACDRLLAQGKGQPVYDHCPTCAWPLKAPKAHAATPVDPAS